MKCDWFDRNGDCKSQAVNSMTRAITLHYCQEHYDRMERFFCDFSPQEIEDMSNRLLMKLYKESDFG